MVLAIEPMINLGVKEVFYDDDGWTVRTKDRKPSAHYEHTFVSKRES
jgi:methionyl aminopeptidase